MTGNKFLKDGFSLIEVIVSVALFAIIILATTQIFKMVVDGQRGAIAAQNVEESLKYFSEVTGKEIRMAQKNSDGACSSLGIDPTKVFKYTYISTSSDSLSFKNHYGQCVTYKINVDGNNIQRFSIQRGPSADWITPAKISVDSLHFIVSESTSTQPLVTLNLQAHALNQAQFHAAMTLQTSIAVRYYK